VTSRWCGLLPNQNTCYYCLFPAVKCWCHFESVHFWLSDWGKWSVDLWFTGDRYFRARVVFIDDDGGSVSSISMSHGTDAGVKTERHVVVDTDRRPTGRVLEGKSRLYAHIYRSDPAVVLFFLFGLVLLIGLSVSLCYPTHHATPPAKPPQVCLSCMWNIACLSSLWLFQLLFSNCDIAQCEHCLIFESVDVLPILLNLFRCQWSRGSIPECAASDIRIKSHCDSCLL